MWFETQHVVARRAEIIVGTRRRLGTKNVNIKDRSRARWYVSLFPGSSRVVCISWKRNFTSDTSRRSINFRKFIAGSCWCLERNEMREREKENFRRRKLIFVYCEAVEKLFSISLHIHVRSLSNWPPDIVRASIRRRLITNRWWVYEPSSLSISRPKPASWANATGRVVKSYRLSRTIVFISLSRAHHEIAHLGAVLQLIMSSSLAITSPRWRLLLNCGFVSEPLRKLFSVRLIDKSCDWLIGLFRMLTWHEMVW